ncbi:radical SAM/SPASM domain-containing protein [Peterkaempfera bronchialis]|uniref:Radical SAM protein n=1 Tax=Peterkaempfera bronchialis TaxID=2126346 RepID=A0A345SXV0_9ACTN|nr:radical SAM protein [Peterkaempfera bronchialis]AXI78555.1 radical SAM protein [Peterkaempfera bronchialis]
MHPTTPNEQIDHLYRSLETSEADAVSVILKVRGETCDIDCLHCYEKRKEGPGGARISADQVDLLPKLFGTRPLAIELHGGEPLTAGKDHIAHLLRTLAAMPQVKRLSLQTNGVQLDAEWLDLFDTLYPGLEIGISLDGDPEGNRWRVDYQGKPTYPAAVRALDLLAECGRTCGIITTVTPAVLGRHAEVLDHLAVFKAVTSVSFVPCFDATITRPTAYTGRRRPASRALQQAVLTGLDGPAWAITPDQYAEFVLGVTQHWMTSGLFRRLKLSPAVPTIRRLRGLGVSFCHFSDMKCDHVFTLYPDGRMGSCDELPWPQAQLTVLQPTTGRAEITAAQRNSNLLGQGKDLMRACMTCDYRTTCGGGCIATRWRMNLTGQHDAYCDYRMRLIDGTAALLADPEHPGGAWCRTARWRPTPVNRMRDVQAFLTTWDNPTAPRRPAELHTSEFGNINTTGLPGTQLADDLDPAHPQWAAAIEPGVKPLVDHLTSRWHLVTYDSCEGHQYDDPARNNQPRDVGLLPRTPTEYAATAVALCRAANRCAAAMPAAVRLLVARNNLTCETTGRTYPVLDLRLLPTSGTADSAYFAILDAATALLLGALEADAPNEGTCCACPLPADTHPELPQATA